MAERGRQPLRSPRSGILNHDFLVALVREQIRQVLPEATREVTRNTKVAAAQTLTPKATTSVEPLRVGVAEAARIIGVSRARLYEHIRKGSIKIIKDGKRTLFTMKELRNFVASTDPNHDDGESLPPSRK